MTKERRRLEEIKEELIDLQNGDIEDNHIAADTLLLEALAILSDLPIIAEIQAAHNKITKWYA